MKKIFATIFFLTACIHVVTAQQRDNDVKIQALKIAFITQRLKLTSAEAQKFWPVFNAYDNEMIKQMHESKSGDVLGNEEKMLQIRKKYSNSFEKIIGKERTNTLFSSEREFRNILIKRLKNHKPGGGRNR